MNNLIIVLSVIGSICSVIGIVNIIIFIIQLINKKINTYYNNILRYIIIESILKKNKVFLEFILIFVKGNLKRSIEKILITRDIINTSFIKKENLKKIEEYIYISIDPQEFISNKLSNKIFNIFLINKNKFIFDYNYINTYFEINRIMCEEYKKDFGRTSIQEKHFNYRHLFMYFYKDIDNIIIIKMYLIGYILKNKHNFNLDNYIDKDNFVYIKLIENMNKEELYIILNEFIDKNLHGDTKIINNNKLDNWYSSDNSIFLDYIINTIWEI